MLTNNEILVCHLPEIFIKYECATNDTNRYEAVQLNLWTESLIACVWVGAS